MQNTALSPQHKYAIGETPVAALDIGSNSFHMVVAQPVGNDFQILTQTKEQVCLAAGLDHRNRLTEPAIQSAFSCLERFGEQLNNVQPANIRAVATHTLRVAGNAGEFIDRARAHFPAPIKIISGTEEARLIYQGVTHLSDIHDQVLIIDIGGGSTEFVIGENFVEKQLRSCPVGCITLTARFFEHNRVSSAGFRSAVKAVEQSISPFRRPFGKTGWKLCLGSSGSIKTVASILKAQGYNKRSITMERLLALREQILAFGSLDNIELPGLLASRSRILPAAIAILIGAFNALHIERMEYSRGALREGLLYNALSVHGSGK